MHPISTAACLAVGSELLCGRRLDSNSLVVSTRLAGRGVRVTEKRVVGDDRDAVAGAIRELLTRVDLVVITGGLGPTADDVTREGVAAAFDLGLNPNAEVEAWIREGYLNRGRDMPAIAPSMARVVEGSRPLRNRRGAAPGLLLERGSKLVAALPGVPWEMRDMLEHELEPELARRGTGTVVLVRTLLLGGVVESDVEGRVHHLYDRFGRSNVSILASCGLVRLVMTAEGIPEAAGSRLDEMAAAFRTAVGADLAGVDVETLAEPLIAALEARGETLAAAESCTGGLVGAELTSVPGSSAVFLGGVVSYSNQAKETMVGVAHELLVAHGAVSEPVARAMAGGVRARFGTTWGIGITGIAGPAGGTVDKPVGLVHWAVAGPCGIRARQARFPGDRESVRRWSVNAALDLLRRTLE